MQEQDMLDAMAFIESISRSLKTTSYIWGGFTLDIYEGKFLREHSDIDYLTINLLKLRPQFIALFQKAGWHVKIVANGDLSARYKEVKLHLGNINFNNQAVWTHNGKKGSLRFPSHWLNKEPFPFYNIRVHAVKAEFEYVIKHFPALLNLDWKPRHKDVVAQQALSELLLKKNISTQELYLQVSSTHCES